MTKKGWTSKLGVVLKVALGVAVFAWMVHSGKLHLAEVGKSLTNWPMVLAVLALDYTQVGLTTWRWRLLLNAQRIPLGGGRAWGLVMIGMLFNMVIPGSVGGDLIKGYYLTRAAPDRKSQAAISVLVDRVAGLVGLLLLGTVMAAVNFHETMRNASTQQLGALTAALFVAGIAGLYVPVLAGNRIARWQAVPARLREIFAGLDDYRKQVWVLPSAILLSVLSQALACGTYYLAFVAGGGAGMPLGQFLLIVPLGLVITAIPVSPGGVGVGQAGFFALFRIVAPAYAAVGTDSFTVYQVLMLLVCLSGVFWYVPYRHPEEAAQASA